MDAVNGMTAYLRRAKARSLRHATRSECGEELAGKQARRVGALLRAEHQRSGAICIAVNTEALSKSPTSPLSRLSLS